MGADSERVGFDLSTPSTDTASGLCKQSYRCPKIDVPEKIREDFCVLLSSVKNRKFEYSALSLPTHISQHMKTSNTPTVRVLAQLRTAGVRFFADNLALTPWCT